MISTKNFISFADDKYKRTLERIGLEAETSQFFDSIILYLEQDLPEDLRKYCSENDRGYGFWSWKPYLILERLKELKEGDILIYADAGCTIDETCELRYNEYMEYLETYDVLCFRIFYKFTTRKWTKMNLVNYLNCDHLMDKAQIIATAMLIKKTPETIRMVEEWYEISKKRQFIDDSQSTIPNDKSFIDHRHDQSIFSLLCYLNEEKCKILMLEDEPGMCPDCPIKATRIRD